MRIIEDVRQAVDIFPNLVLTVGSFDGVHLGHRRILSDLILAARTINGTAAVLTLRPHPREFFSPNHPPSLLTSEKMKLRLFEHEGIDTVYILPFDHDTAIMDPADFVHYIIHDKCHAEALVVGHDFNFGAGALGDYAFLERMSQQYGFSVSQTPALIIDGERVSSTLIRERLAEGDLDGAERFLGRRYSVLGNVASGRGIGIQLGFPTANVIPHHSAIPANGVYAAEVIIDGICHPAAVNIGVAPTIQHDSAVIEAHLLSFNEDIREKEIEIVFHKRFRPEKKFSSRDELITAIHHDVDAIRHYFARY